MGAGPGGTEMCRRLGHTLRTSLARARYSQRAAQVLQSMQAEKVRD